MDTKGDKRSGKTRLVLASGSPQRSALLKDHGYQFVKSPPQIDEPQQLSEGTSPVRQAEALSYFKARSVADRLDEGIVIAADTVVALAETVFGKPRDRADARRILTSLGGTTHEVITGVTILDAAKRRRLIRSESTAVTMRLLSDTELESYLDTGAWAGKAGAYGIQDQGDPFVRTISGSFTNVVGLPMELLSRMFAELAGAPCESPGRCGSYPAPVTRKVDV